MNGFGPFGICTMDQERTMNHTCSGQGSMNNYGPNGVLNGQFGNGPGYTDCPYYPCDDCPAR
jgi:hypothetical protein